MSMNEDAACGQTNFRVKLSIETKIVNSNHENSKVDITVNFLVDLLHLQLNCTDKDKERSDQEE